jgi:hypothetical protein
MGAKHSVFVAPGAAGAATNRVSTGTQANAADATNTKPPEDEHAWQKHPLVQAVQHGDVSFLVDFFARYEVDVNGLTAADGSGMTLLHLAVQADQPDVTSFLLSRGALVNAVDSRGKTPLMFGVWHKSSAKTIDVLLNRGANVDARTPKGFSVFHLAIRAGSYTIISRIRKAQPNINTCSTDGLTPLHDACELPASVANPLVDAMLRCQRYNARTGAVTIPRNKADATELIALQSTLRESLGTHLALTPAAMAASPLRPPNAADDAPDDELCGSSASGRDALTRRNPAAWPRLRQQTPPTPASSAPPFTPTRSRTLAELESPPPPPGSPPPSDAIDADDFIQRQPTSPGSRSPASPQRRPVVRCGACDGIFGTCSCVLSAAPCYTPGRWRCTLVDATTPAGATVLHAAAVHGNAQLVAMLMQFRANAMLEDMVL